jgi:hypothetical protein
MIPKPPLQRFQLSILALLAGLGLILGFPALSKAETEAETIESLLAHIESMSDAVFIRNGKEYGAEEAARHLRRKWERAVGFCDTVDSFVENCATRSFLTGRPYQIRIAGGPPMPLAEHLRRWLAERNDRE